MGFSSFVVFVWLLSGMNSDTNAGDFFGPLILRGVGLGFLFTPLLTITIYPIKNKDVPQATAFMTMVRQLGGSFGIALSTTYLSVRSTFHYSNLSEHVSVFNNVTYERLQHYTHLFLSNGSDLLKAQTQAAAALHGSIMQQALILTYNDVFLIVGLFFAACIPFLLLFKTKKEDNGLLEVASE